MAIWKAKFGVNVFPQVVHVSSIASLEGEPGSEANFSFKEFFYRRRMIVSLNLKRILDTNVDMLSQEFMDLLCCPKCRGQLSQIAAPSGLHCAACHLFYAIEDGIPNLLIEESQPDSVLNQ